MQIYLSAYLSPDFFHLNTTVWRFALFVGHIIKVARRCKQKTAIVLLKMNFSESPSTSQVLQEFFAGRETFLDDCPIRQKSISPTFQHTSLCPSVDLSSFERNAGNALESWTYEKNLGGTIGHSETDGSIFGGKFRSVALEDVQVVPDFGDVLDSHHENVLPAPFAVADSILSPQVYNDSPGPKRRDSERDELEIYLPCVLTPIPVDRLYSTLDKDSTIFVFPGSSDKWLLNDKAKQVASSEQEDISLSIFQRNRHSLDSFANESIFSFPEGNDSESDISTMKSERTLDFYPQVEFSTEGTSSVIGDHCGATVVKGQSCFLGIDRPSIFEEQDAFAQRANVEENISFPKALGNCFCTETSNFDSGEDKMNRKDSAVLNLSHSTTYNIPIQSKSATTLLNHHQFGRKFSLNTELPPFTNLPNMLNRSSKPVLIEDGNCKGDESFPRTSSTSFVEVTPGVLNSKILNEPKSSLETMSERVTDLSTSDGEEKRENNSLDLITCKSERMKFRSKSKSMRSFHCDNSRIFHNDMEKQRRVNMKTRFENLRIVVPALLDRKKASKIIILQKAIECIGMLERESIVLENVKGKERLRNAELLNRLQKITAQKCI